MNDLDPDALLEEHADGRGMVPYATLEPAMREMGDDVRQLLAHSLTGDLLDKTPEERRDLLRFRDWLHTMRDAFDHHLRRIDMQWLELRRYTGQREFVMPDNTRVQVDDGPATYVVQGKELRDALLACARDGLLTADEVNQAIRQEVTYRPDNTKLNSLARNRGDRVREIVNTYRQRVEAAPLTGKVHYPRRADR